MNIDDTYAHYLKLTGTPEAAATLTLAATMAGSQPKPDPLLTVAQAAERMQVSETAVREACLDGKLRHSRIGRGRGTIRIAPGDLDAFREDMQTGSKLRLRHLA